MFINSHSKNQVFFVFSLQDSLNPLNLESNSNITLD